MRYSALILATLLCACTAPTGTNTNDPIPVVGSQGGNGQSGSAGDAGENGNNGSAGSAGKDGVNGTDNKIAHSWSCNFTSQVSAASQSGQTGPFIGSINFWFHASETTSGDTFSRGALDATNYASRVISSANSTEFWPANTPQAKHASVYLALDLIFGANVSSGNKLGTWEFSLVKDKNAIIITYTDPDIVGGFQTFTSPCE
jgi:hypothetical protein